MKLRGMQNYVYLNLARLSPSVLYGATFCLALSLTCAWYFFCTLALSKAITSYSSHIEQLKKKKLVAEKKIKGKDTLAEQLAVLENVLDSQHLPIPSNVKSPQDSLLALFAQHNIQVSDCSPETKEVYSRSAAMTVTYSLNGSYENFIKFFAAQRKCKPVQIIGTCLMTRSPNGIHCALAISHLIGNAA